MSGSLLLPVYHPRCASRAPGMSSQPILIIQDVYAAHASYILSEYSIRHHTPGCVRRIICELHTGRVSVSCIIVCADRDRIV